MLISIDGDVLIQGDEPYELQKERVGKIVGEIRRYLPAVITHGSGTLISNFLLQQEKIPPKYPLFFLTAMAQALIGEMIAEHIKRSVVILTHVDVDPEDPEFKQPTKPIGPFYDKKIFPTMLQYDGKWRRVVPGPKPIDVKEKELIKRFFTAGYTVICGGGGGIPLANGKAVDAVVDKDLTSAFIARFVGVKEMMFITKTRYLQRDGEEIRILNIEEARALLKEVKGGVRSKIEAAIDFIMHGGNKVMICGVENIGNGTVIK